jgi:hypothetical protein
MDNATTTGPSPQPAEEPKGALWRLQGIFFQPRRTFEEINKKPTWLIALVLTVVIGAAAMYVMTSRIGVETIIAQQNPNQELNEQQREFMESPFMAAFFYASVVIGTPLVILVIAVVMMLLYWMAGSEAPFSRVFSVVTHSFFAYSLIGSVIAVLIILLAQDPTELDFANLVSSNLGVLVDRIESPVLFSLLSSIDLFSAYLIFLLSLGLSIVGRKSIGASVWLVIVPWIIYVAGKTAIAYLRS